MFLMIFFMLLSAPIMIIMVLIDRIGFQRTQITIDPTHPFILDLFARSLNDGSTAIPLHRGQWIDLFTASRAYFVAAGSLK